MATAQLQSCLEEKVIDYLQDAHAMEANVLRMLDSMISTTSDPEVLHQLKRHRMDTERHGRMLQERLEALGSGPSFTAEAPAILGAWLKGLADKVRTDKPGKNARDGYITEHVEIAAYSLLEQLADRAGDLETARVARFIRDDEVGMARWIADRWGRFIDLTLQEGNCPIPSPSDSRWYSEQGNGSQPRWRSYQPASSVARVLACAAGLTLVGFLFSQWHRREGQQTWRGMMGAGQGTCPH
jgi:ferritin-like metal-binding protein YciE